MADRRELARGASLQTEYDLTLREDRVVELAADGTTNSEIAGQLFISPSTSITTSARCSGNSASDHGTSSPAGCTALPRHTWLRPGTNYRRTGGPGAGTQR
jgi:hypothetical protein